MLQLKEIRIGMSGKINTGDYQNVEPSVDLTFAVLDEENWDEAIQRACNLTHDALMWGAKRLLVNVDDDLRECWLRQLGDTASITVQTVGLSAEDEAVMNLALMETSGEPDDDNPFDDDDSDEDLPSFARDPEDVFDEDFEGEDSDDPDDYDDLEDLDDEPDDFDDDDPDDNFDEFPDEVDEDEALIRQADADERLNEQDLEDTKEVIVQPTDKIGADF